MAGLSSTVPAPREPAGGAPRPAPRRVTPGGVLAVLLVLAAVVVCARLGFWQLDRLAERRAQNEALLRAMEEPALVLDGAMAARIGADPEAFRFRRVRVEGVFDGASDLILRGRAYQGRPGVHLFAPLALDGGGAVMVNRGWIPAADGVTADPRAFPARGRQAAEGIVHPFPDARGAGSPMEITVDGFRVPSLGRLDLDALQALSARPLLPFYVQLTPAPGADEAPVRLAAPPIDEGSHLSYAVQWFGFAAVFLIGLLVVMVRRPDLRGGRAGIDP